MSNERKAHAQSNARTCELARIQTSASHEVRLEIVSERTRHRLKVSTRTHLFSNSPGKRATKQTGAIVIAANTIPKLIAELERAGEILLDDETSNTRSKRLRRRGR